MAPTHTQQQQHQRGGNKNEQPLLFRSRFLLLFFVSINLRVNEGKLLLYSEEKAAAKAAAATPAT
jgi:hypothetical protein